MGNSRGRLSIGDFNEGGAEPDGLYSTQASNSKLDLSRLAVYLRDEPVNCSYKMAGQVMINETQDQSSSGLFEEIHPVVDLTKEKKRKLDRINDDFPDLCQVLLEVRVCLSQLKEELQILKKRIESSDRRDATFQGAPVPERINLPNPACIPRNKTNAHPQANTDPQEQGNEPNNQEPVPGVQADEVPADSLSEPLLIGIHATNVLSVGRGSHAEEASQNGTNWRNRDLCCCYIM